MMRRVAPGNKRPADRSVRMRAFGEVKERFRYIRDRTYSAVEAEMKDAKAERPFDFGLIDITNRYESRPHGARWNE